MSYPRRPLAALIVALAGACPSLASAWGGYGPPPYGPPGAYPPAYPGSALWLPPVPGYPGWPAVPPPNWEQAPESHAAPRLGSPPAAHATPAPERTAPFGEPWMPPPGLEGAPGGPRDWGRPGGLRISREATQDTYLIRIDIGDAKPEDIQISPVGRGLAISRKSEALTEREDSFDDGRGYRRSFSFARGTSSRRLPLPPDADPAGMTREVSDKAIVLRIPRTRGRGFGPGPDASRPDWLAAPNGGSAAPIRPWSATPRPQTESHSGPTP